jgi:hypothetical protein
MRQSIHPLGDTTYHFVKANVLNSLQDKEIAALKDRIKHLEDALRRIANADYRGNRSTESQIAFEALKEVNL